MKNILAYVVVCFCSATALGDDRTYEILENYGLRVETILLPEKQKQEFLLKFIEEAKKESLGLFPDIDYEKHLDVLVYFEKTSVSYYRKNVSIESFGQIYAGHASVEELVRVLKIVLNLKTDKEIGLPALKAFGIVDLTFTTAVSIGSVSEFVSNFIKTMKERKVTGYSNIALEVGPENMWALLGYSTVEEMGPENNSLKIKVGYDSHEGLVDLLIKGYGFREGE